MTDREIMQMALDALANFDLDVRLTVIPALRARLAQPEQDDGYCQVCDGNHCTAKNGCIALDNPRAQPEPEPVAWLYEGSDIEGRDVCLNEDIFEEQKPNCIPLYTVPPQREWQGLTDEEIHSTNGYEEDRKLYRFARAIEAKLKEKNG